VVATRIPVGRRASSRYGPTCPLDNASSCTDGASNPNGVNAAARTDGRSASDDTNTSATGGRHAVSRGAGATIKAGTATA
jgi:hypothetical protein